MKYINLAALSIFVITLASCSPKTQPVAATDQTQPVENTNTNINTNEPLNHTITTDINTEIQLNPFENTNTKDKNDTSPLPSVGSIITFGNYEQDNDTTNGKEPIKWRVLEIDSVNHKMLLLSEYVLDAQPYHIRNKSIILSSVLGRKRAGVPITWAKSSLRTWLNDTFITTAFSATEQAKILTTHLDNPDNPFYDTAGGVATDDKVFLLGLDDVYGEDSHYSAGYFNNANNRMAMATRYAVKQGVLTYYIDIHGSCDTTNYQVNKCLTCWWLRSPGDYADYAANVDMVGVVSYSGFSVYDEYCGVRPALWVNY